MKIVIDIPEDLYEVTKEEGIPSYKEERNVLADAIANGTPLPKEYEKLIDVGQCNRKLFYQQCGGADSLITVKSAFDMLMSLPEMFETENKMSICGDCGICACGDFCLAGRGDDDFVLASKEKIIHNLKNNCSPSQRDLMIKTLKEIYSYEWQESEEE